ncbi:hypothetical protein [Roseateles amylovorans]|uniref:Uncharacterized protein n=1 Tax=Roseateles amylovorans TaxID=2978473 RepID=A0ABY6BAV2_9BURK|nr:hypothetical protein [Roseateles amylovorans]UXH80332.1 hypothetical protein N4261_10835 [Roseateles amylovorans]
MRQRTTDLPRNLRTLLFAVDGRTDSKFLESNLSSFGDLPLLFKELEQAGYIEQVPSSKSSSGSSTKSAQNRFSTTLPAEEAHEWARRAETRSSRERKNVYQPAHGSSVTGGNEMNPRVAEYQLKAAVNLMSDFVAIHFPERQLEIVLELERLSSVEALARQMPSYLTLIKSLGEVSRQHLKELQLLLSSN